MPAWECRSSDCGLVTGWSSNSEDGVCCVRFRSKAGPVWAPARWVGRDRGTVLFLRVFPDHSVLVESHTATLGSVARDCKLPTSFQMLTSDSGKGACLENSSLIAA
ncbi:hypothetical protein CEXT_129961 [Caerostris extrusa]|uniref:Uncharacterized protein n=1 Tax=Caerostris extrusa TaxID=172846 RepID=A0AAV4QD43_CAEEX|nr:hypothetical protein CEXT_129961 [Caerostris extrusa]